MPNLQHAVTDRWEDWQTDTTTIKRVLLAEAQHPRLNGTFGNSLKVCWQEAEEAAAGDDECPWAIAKRRLQRCSLLNKQGAKLRKIIWFPFGNPPLKFGFPKLFQALRRVVENLSESLALIFTGCPVGNPSKNWVSSSVFGCSGHPETH